MQAKAKKKSAIQQFVNQATMTFKTFDYQVVVSKNKSNLWHYVATPPNGAKKYMVYCAPNLAKVKNLIKAAVRKVPRGSKLVVVCQAHTQEETQMSEELGYTLITLGELKKYGTEMIEAKARGDEDNDGGNIEIVA